MHGSCAVLLIGWSICRRDSRRDRRRDSSSSSDDDVDEDAKNPDGEMAGFSFTAVQVVDRYCEVYSSKFEAELACSSDASCGGVSDPGCDGTGVFRLCGETNTWTSLGGGRRQMKSDKSVNRRQLQGALVEHCANQVTSDASLTLSWS